MSIEQLAGTDLRYHLIAFDTEGRERAEAGGELASRKALEELTREPVTDVFLFSHGWQSDVPAAKRQYAAWITAMAGCTDDIAALNRARGGAFRPLLIGLHWPSQPFGDEDLGGGGAVSFAPTAERIEPLVDLYAGRIADTPAAREALRTIFVAALKDVAPAALPPDVAAAYKVLDRESGLGAEGPGADPGADREPDSAERVYRRAAAESVGISGFDAGGLLALPRTLSFWKMKDRARQFGESGGARLLAALQGAKAAARFHLMGHSFGCIVVSAAVAGAGGRGPLSRPVDSMALMQGALSLWSYCDAIPVAPGQSGYFRSIVADQRVRGPIVSTQSEFDVAVGRWYPLASRVAHQVTIAPGELPKYGGVGTFGIRGLDDRTLDATILNADRAYGFQPARVYNIESSGVIRKSENFFTGAHSDIAHPEVAHIVWEAARGG